VFLWIVCSVAALTIGFSSCAHQRLPDYRLLDETICRTLETEISGTRTLDYIQKIAAYHRIEGAYENSDYEKAVNYVLSVLREGKVRDVKLYTFPSDGYVRHGTWLTRPGFRVKRAILQLVDPHLSKWCDFSETAVSLMTYSNGAGISEAEVVYVGKGTSDADYQDREVKGKIVFADRSDAAGVMRQAVLKRGALGIVMGFSGNKRRAAFPDLVELNRLYITGEEAKRSSWGFSLSKTQTDSLKDLLKKQTPVVMRAEVFAETFPGNMPVISAVIPGSRFPDQEIIYMAHLDHYRPGANDNASGSAGLMEMATVLTRLIRDGKIPPPLRTVRFLWVPEWEGTVAYLEEHSQTVKKGIVAINMDMIGEDLEKCDTHLFITSTPLSRPSFLNGLLCHYSRYVAASEMREDKGSDHPFEYEQIGYFGESDHMLFNDAQIGVPSTMLVHLTDRFWHSSMDTPDKVDPTQLKRTIMLGLLVGWTSACFDISDVNAMAGVVVEEFEKKLDDFSDTFRERLKQAGEKELETMHRNILSYYDILHENAVQSLQYLYNCIPEEEPDSVFYANTRLLKADIETRKQRMSEYYRQRSQKMDPEAGRAGLSEFEKECSALFPRRLFSQSLDYWTAVGIARERGVPGSVRYDAIWEMLNHADGEHHLMEIRDVASAQFQEIPIQQVRALFDGFEEKNLIRYNP
jgi:hypothetical protein